MGHCVSGVHAQVCFFFASNGILSVRSRLLWGIAKNKHRRSDMAKEIHFLLEVVTGLTEMRLRNVHAQTPS